jgi:hypothetical protein
MAAREEKPQRLAVAGFIERLEEVLSEIRVRLAPGFRPDRWDLLGAAICVVGALVMVAPPRG